MRAVLQMEVDGRVMREESTYQTLLDAYTQRGHEVLALEREIAHLRRGIETYRATTPCHIEQCGWPECPSCLWERDDEKRRESGDER